MLKYTLKNGESIEFEPFPFDEKEGYFNKTEVRVWFHYGGAPGNKSDYVYVTLPTGIASEKLDDTYRSMRKAVYESKPPYGLIEVAPRLVAVGTPSWDMYGSWYCYGIYVPIKCGLFENDVHMFIDPSDIVGPILYDRDTVAKTSPKLLKDICSTR